jgi:hypothetical protein
MMLMLHFDHAVATFPTSWLFSLHLRAEKRVFGLNMMVMSGVSSRSLQHVPRSYIYIFKMCENNLGKFTHYCMVGTPERLSIGNM